MLAVRRHLALQGDGVAFGQFCRHVLVLPQGSKHWPDRLAIPLSGRGLCPVRSILSFANFERDEAWPALIDLERIAGRIKEDGRGLDPGPGA
jgi:hypothetical protein